MGLELEGVRNYSPPGAPAPDLVRLSRRAVQAKSSPKKGRPHPRHDWTAIRIARETSGTSFRALAQEFGASDSGIRKRAKQDQWRDPREVGAEVAQAAADEISRRFVAQEAEAVFENRARIHALNSRILDLVEKRLDELESGNFRGVRGSDTLELRRIGLAISTVEMVDARVAGRGSASAGR